MKRWIGPVSDARCFRLGIDGRWERHGLPALWERDTQAVDSDTARAQTLRLECQIPNLPRWLFRLGQCTQPFCEGLGVLANCAMEKRMSSHSEGWV